MIPLVVTAHLQQGFVATDPWSPSLDGILAAMVLQEELGPEEYALGSSGGRGWSSPDLPLEQDGAGDDWWWCASSPLVGEAIQHDAWYHRRYDFAQAIDRVDEKTRRVQVQGGPYKAYRNRETITIPIDRQVLWAAIGERDEIIRLLRRCTVVGKGGAHGRGIVLGWDVREADDPDRTATLARNHRPLPVETALDRGLTGPVLRWGIRPPGRAPEHQRQCVMP